MKNEKKILKYQQISGVSSKLHFSLLYNDDIGQESFLLVYMLTSNSLPCLLYVKHYPRISQFSEEVQYVDVFDVKLKPAHWYQAGGGGHKYDIKICYFR